MNGQGGARKSYKIDSILTKFMNEQGQDKDYYLKLVTIGKVAYLIGRYTVHSLKFGIDNPNRNKN